MGDLYHTYPPDWRGRPAQMPIPEQAIWREFLTRRGREWRAYAYDVELHGGDTPILGTDPEIARAWARAIAKRADVIAERASGYTIIEIKVNGGYSAIGQALVYRQLFPKDYPSATLEGTMLVCEKIDPSIRAAASAAGLDVWTTND